MIVPIFKPLGIERWEVSTAFITGFMAKESVVSTLTLLIGDVKDLVNVFTPISAFSFLVFSLLYTPCVATIATVKKELGLHYAVGIVLLQCTIAWFVSYLVYNLAILL